LIEIEKEEYKGTPGSKKGTYTIAWKSHAVTVMNYLLDHPLECNGSIRLNTLSEALAAFKASH